MRRVRRDRPGFADLPFDPFPAPAVPQSLRRARRLALACAEVLYVIRRAVVLVALAAALLPASSRAADPPAAAVPLATVGSTIPGEVAPASVLRPSTFRAAFRVPRADSALYIGVPWYARDLSITVVGPGAHRETVVATDDLPGHLLGLRVPGDAWVADRVELESTVVSNTAQPFLISAEALAVIALSNWWYQPLFGMLVAVAVLLAALAVARRSRACAWYAAATASQAALLVPYLGTVRLAPELSQPLHTVTQVFGFIAMLLFTFAFFPALRLPRAAVRALWILLAVAAVVVAAGDVLQDVGPFPELIALAVLLVALAFVAIGVVAVVRRLEGARYYLVATVLAALAALVGEVPLNPALSQAALLAGAASTLILAFALVTQLAPSTARTDGERFASAQLDGLTGIPNRPALDDALARAWDRARRARSPLAALLLDIDHFKQYNEQYGHHAGDDALRRIADVLAQTVARRHDDLAARYGGEEFLVLLPDTDLAGARRVAHAILLTVEALDIAHGGEPSKRLSVSIGVASLVPEHAGEGGELVRRAANALYVAKTLGRNRVVVDEPAEPAAPLLR
jgi:diguanylate cyclase (GGDEF)-like protein